jgi:hypothetical protein
MTFDAAINSDYGRKRHFYEKVVKVKADVAAILKFCSRCSDGGRSSRRGPGSTHRGDAQGGFQRSALKPLLRGEPRHRCVPALFAGAQRASGVGGTRPPPAFPQRGKRERGSSNFLAAAGTSRCRDTDGRHAASGMCARSSLTFSSRFRSPTICRLRRSAFQKSCWQPPTPLPCFYPHSRWAASRPGASWGPISSPGPSPR